MLKDYEDDKMEQILFSEHPERQILISPVEATFQQKLEHWKSQPYVCKAFSEDAPVIMTNKGLRVRSKSEKIMADYFDSIPLAFKYECPLHLEPYGTIYPGDNLILTFETSVSVIYTDVMKNLAREYLL